MISPSGLTCLCFHSCPCLTWRDANWTGPHHFCRLVATSFALAVAASAYALGAPEASAGSARAAELAEKVRKTAKHDGLATDLIPRRIEMFAGCSLGGNVQDDEDAAIAGLKGRARLRLA